jgi:dolichol-phosphate mannosyltransferase
MNKASLSEWNLGRKALTNLGHLFTRLFLRMPYDATGAFRLYRLDRIPKEVFELVGSSGYSFFFESLHILHLNSFKIKEIPIILPARTYGHSKMNWQEPFLGLKKLIKIFFNTLFNRRQYLLQGTTKN